MNWCSHINKPAILFLGIIFIQFSCNYFNTSGEEEVSGDVIAEVNERKLYKKTLAEMDFSSASEEDSAQFAEIYIDRWIRDQLLLIEAKEKLEEDPKVQSLVDEYRNSLLLHEYEQQVIRERLDSNVAEDILKDHYEEKKSSYILNHDLYRVKWISTQSSNINLDSVRVIWERNDSNRNESLSSLVELYARSFNLNPNDWWKQSELNENLGLTKEDWEQLSLKETVTIDKEEGKLIIRLLDKRNRGDYAPLAYVEDNIRKFILHQRKENILKEVRNELFRSAVEKNKIKIY